MKYKVIIMEEGRTEPLLVEETDMLIAIMLKADIHETGNVALVEGDATAKQLVSMRYACDAVWERLWRNAPEAALLHAL